MSLRLEALADGYVLIDGAYVVPVLFQSSDVARMMIAFAERLGPVGPAATMDEKVAAAMARWLERVNPPLSNCVTLSFSNAAMALDLFLISPEFLEMGMELCL